MNMSNEELGNIVLAFDEILVNTAPYIYSKIRQNWDEYRPFFKDIGPLTEEKLFNRTEKYIDEWLIKDELKEEYKNNSDFRNLILLSL